MPSRNADQTTSRAPRGCQRTDAAAPLGDDARVPMVCRTADEVGAGTFADTSPAAADGWSWRRSTGVAVTPVTADDSNGRSFDCRSVAAPAAKLGRSPVSPAWAGESLFGRSAIRTLLTCDRSEVGKIAEGCSARTSAIRSRPQRSPRSNMAPSVLPVSGNSLSRLCRKACRASSCNAAALRPFRLAAAVVAIVDAVIVVAVIGPRTPP